MPANTLGYCTVAGNRNCLTLLGALQPQDKFNPVFITRNMGYFGQTSRKDLAESLSFDIPIGVETAVIKDNQPIQQQIDFTMKPTNTSLKVGFNRMIGDISDTLSGGRYPNNLHGKFSKQPLGDTNDRYHKAQASISADGKNVYPEYHKGAGMLDRIGSAIGYIEKGLTIKEGVSDILEAGQELAFGPIGTALSNIASEKYNKNPNWRPGFSGEQHAVIDTPWGLTRANYLGPGTNLLERLARNDPSVDGPNGLDACAKVHDIAYGLARTADDVRAADDVFLNCLAKVETSTAMKTFVMGLFKTKKLAEDVGFLDPSKFAPDIRQQVEQAGLGGQMHKAQQLGMGFTGYKPEGSFASENVMMGVGLKKEVKDISKFFIKSKKDMSGQLRQLRNIAFSVPGVKEKIEEKMEEFLPGQQLKEQLVGLVKKMPTKKKKKGKKGKGFSAENVMMGVGVPKQEEYSGHILAGNVPKKNSKYKYGVTGDRIGHNTISNKKSMRVKGVLSGGAKKTTGGQFLLPLAGLALAKGKKKRKGKKKKRSQEGGQILAGIIASVVVPELIKFVSGKISKAISKKKKKKR